MTERQREAAELRAKGMTYRAIAKALGISVTRVWALLKPHHTEIRKESRETIKPQKAIRDLIKYSPEEPSAEIKLSSEDRKALTRLRKNPADKAARIRKLLYSVGANAMMTEDQTEAAYKEAEDALLCMRHGWCCGNLPTTELGFSRFGRMRRVTLTRTGYLDGLKVYHLSLSCRHVIHISASGLGRHAKHRRCPLCLAGKARIPAPPEASA